MEKRKRKFGDRKDARLCRDVTGMSQICVDLKPKRYMSELYLDQRFDVTNLVNYINKHKDDDQKLTYFHAFVMAIGKTIYNRPLLNRFIANRHIYEHNDVTISFVMKIDFNDKSEEIMVVIPILENDNIFTISKKISDKVNSIRTKGDTGEGANDAIQILGKMPNILRVPIVGILKWMDDKGWLPASLMKDNIYYSSMLVSNIGSLKCDAIYHNITDFGTCPGVITMGEIKNEGKKYYCDFGMTMDERATDGFYLIKSIKLIQYLLDNPEILEGSANEKIEIK